MAVLTVMETKSATTSVPHAAELIGISKSKAYGLCRESTELAAGVPIIRVGSQYKIPTAALERLLGIDIATGEPLAAGTQVSR